jgi:hypothetical protein
LKEQPFVDLLNPHMTSKQARKTPLELLVVSQLAALRRREAAVQSRLYSCVSPEATGIVAAEVSRLQISTDRLSRMIDAMA